MSLSSNSIIHLTKSKKQLEEILNIGLRPHYCTETLSIDGDIYELCVPMVSFCDIPLSKIKDHIGKYGEYGIGLTKEWAIKNKLNPVVYIEAGSNFSESIHRIIINSLSTGDTDSWDDEQKSVGDIIRYVKNYQGDLTRKGKTTKAYRYSDEREWRFVPAFKEACEMFLEKKSMDTKFKKLQQNSTLKNLILKFEPNDIKYIFVKHDKDIYSLLDTLKTVTWSNFTGKDIERLTTRIFTTEQIKSDV